MELSIEREEQMQVANTQKMGPGAMARIGIAGRERR
jgi:hypothetical protein